MNRVVQHRAEGFLTTGPGWEHLKSRCNGWQVRDLRTIVGLQPHL